MIISDYNIMNTLDSYLTDIMNCDLVNSDFYTQKGK